LSSVDGKECVLMLTNTGVVLVEPSDGTMLGEHEWMFPGYRVVQPLVVDGTSVLLGTPMGTGTQRVNVRWNGEAFDAQEMWTTIGMSPYFNDYVVYDGFLYGIDKNIFACVDLSDGTRKWKGGRYGNGQVLLLPSSGQLLVTSEKGELVLLRATPEKHVALARHRVFEGRTWNHPVLVGNRLYVRNAEEAVCLELAVSRTPEKTPEPVSEASDL
jgi:outer membrane protein assembly factor BamB